MRRELTMAMEKAKRRFRNRSAGFIIVVGVTATVVMLPATATATATAQPADDRPSGANRFCSVILGRPVAGQPTPVEAKACATTSAQADAKATKKATSAGYRAAAKTLLFRTYDHVSYGGYQTNFSGYYGTCDREGYTFLADTGWLSVGDTMSSIIGFGRCDTVRLTHQDTGKTGTFYLSTSGIGSWNDNVSWIHVYDR